MITGNRRGVRCVCLTFGFVPERVDCTIDGTNQVIDIRLPKQKSISRHVPKRHKILNRIHQATCCMCDRNGPCPSECEEAGVKACTVSNGVLLCESTGFKSGGHENHVATRDDPMRKRNGESDTAAKGSPKTTHTTKNKIPW